MVKQFGVTLARMELHTLPDNVARDPELLALWATAFDPTREPDAKKRNAAAEELDRRNADQRPALDLEHPDYWAQRIAPGPFLMGDDQASYDWEKPAFVYHIRHPYALARFPVTNRQYRRFLEHLEQAGRIQAVERHRPKYAWDEAGYPPGRGNHPVVGVNWADVSAFAEWVNQLLYAKGILPAGDVVRLPTEPEWERAATYPVTVPPGPPGTGKRVYPWGNTWQPEVPETGRVGSIVPGWLSSLVLKPFGFTRPGNASPFARANVIAVLGPTSVVEVIGHTSVVGIFPHGAADCGAEELAGNVWEWCSTPYQPYPLPEELPVYTLDTTPARHRTRHGMRSGSWYVSSDSARGAHRLHCPPILIDPGFGMRLVRVFA